MKLLKIEPSKNKNKRFTAVYDLDGKKKSVSFGQPGAFTFIDGAPKDVRENYLKRHRVRENWNDPLTAGALSRWIIWGDSRSLKKNIQQFKKKFNL